MGAIWEALHLLTRYGAEDHVIKFAWPPKPPQVLKCLVRCASQPLAELCELGRCIWCRGFSVFMSLDDNGERQRAAGEWDLAVQANGKDGDL